jgi:hypothetical protein
MATPEQYLSTFDLFGDGQAVLADLMEKFGAELFVAGGLEAERKTLVNLGRRQVLDHILAQMGQAKL